MCRSPAGIFCPAADKLQYGAQETMKVRILLTNSSHEDFVLTSPTGCYFDFTLALSTVAKPCLSVPMG